MRISDWSSDVCSSVLHVCRASQRSIWSRRSEPQNISPSNRKVGVPKAFSLPASAVVSITACRAAASSAADRESVESGKTVAVRVDLGGRPILQKKISPFIHHYIIYTNTQIKS